MAMSTEDAKRELEIRDEMPDALEDLVLVPDDD
jgi:hypothetical protein